MSELLSKIGEFFRELKYSLSDGLLFLGGPLDILIAILDIVITTLIIYYILLLLRDSRAWQLLRGVILIVVFALVAGLIGLNTIGFMLSRTISILAIALIVIFQPELRRTLETVGRNRFSPSNWETLSGEAGAHQMIEAIVNACEWMSERRIGALIILERNTRLGELQEQENAVRLDASVTSALLRQIFYTGSPLHDGAVIIRDGRVSAARVHVPLSDNYRLRKDYGLRHRAAVGASEMGDAIAIAVSEERGSISIAIDGVLHVLGNADALRTQLHRLLGMSPQEEKRSLFGWIRRKFNRQPSDQDDAEAAPDDDEDDEAAEEPTSAPPTERKRRWRRRRLKGEGRRRRSARMLSRRQRTGLAVIAFVIALFLWIYVQITVNPLTSRVYSVPIAYHGVEVAEARGYGVQSYTVTNAQITLRARERVLSDITLDNISAYIDLSDVDRSGIVRLPVQVTTETNLYTKVERLNPETITVNIYVLELP